MDLLEKLKRQWTYQWKKRDHALISYQREERDDGIIRGNIEIIYGRIRENREILDFLKEIERSCMNLILEEISYRENREIMDLSEEIERLWTYQRKQRDYGPLWKLWIMQNKEGKY